MRAPPICASFPARKARLLQPRHLERSTSGPCRQCLAGDVRPIRIDSATRTDPPSKLRPQTAADHRNGTAVAVVGGVRDELIIEGAWSARLLGRERVMPLARRPFSW